MTSSSECIELYIVHVMSLQLIVGLRIMYSLKRLLQRAVYHAMFSCISAKCVGPLPFINLWYTGGLFHSYMLDKSICHYRSVGSIVSLLFYF